MVYYRLMGKEGGARGGEGREGGKRGHGNGEKIRVGEMGKGEF